MRRQEGKRGVKREKDPTANAGMKGAVDRKAWVASRS